MGPAGLVYESVPIHVSYMERVSRHLMLENALCSWLHVSSLCEFTHTSMFCSYDVAQVGKE